MNARPVSLHNKLARDKLCRKLKLSGLSLCASFFIKEYDFIKNLKFVIDIK